MSTVHHLLIDLTNLLNESKRRNGDIKAACETALKVIQKPPTTPIGQLSPQDKSTIVVPFLISCKTGNARFANLGVPAIHKLINSKAIESNDIPEIIKALEEAAHLAIDIQLRILQCLPSLMQNYGPFMKGDILLSLLSLCSSLTSNNKSTVVINTASATLQQLFTGVYDAISVDLAHKKLTKTIKIDNDEEIQVDDLSYEGYVIFEELCRIVDNDKPVFFKGLSHIKLNSALEIIESVISSDKQMFLNHREFSYLIRIKLIPSLLRIINNNDDDFPLIVRIMRTLQILLSTQLNNLLIEGEIILSIFNHILLNNDSSDWQKFLVLEVFKHVFSHFNLVKIIFESYDQDPKKKNVVQELLSILSTYLQYNSYLVETTMKVPDAHTSDYLSRSNSTLKISILDSLDKSEVPVNIPRSYPLYLIFSILLSLTDGVGKYVQSLSNNEETANLDSELEFVQNLISSTYDNTSLLLKYYIHSLMDGDYFHQLIRSLQKFTHTTGLLGLNNLRDGLLIILAESIIKQDKEKPQAPTEKGSMLQEQGKNLFAFGESIVESFTTGETSFSKAEPQGTIVVTFNSRHITCFRALINLAISLGSTLNDSWKIIWITFQWCDYYVKGPNEFSGTNKNEDHFITHLSQQEIANISNSMNKFYDSVSEYPVQSYRNMINSLIDLFEDEFSGDILKDTLIQLSTCPQNKVYFINEIHNISKINPLKFLIEENTFNMICQLFIKYGITKIKGLGFNFRIYIIKSLNDIIKNLALESVNNEDNDTFNRVSEISLGGLSSLIDELNGVKNDELLVINNKIEIHSIILNTLNELIENYNKTLTTEKAWNIIFRIINNPFEFRRDELNGNVSDGLSDKYVMLLSTSFNSLKLILNEFIVNLPINKFKILIDTLFSFCSQNNDLNISFSSISYFWLIGDSIKNKLNEKQDGIEDSELLNEDQLSNFIESEEKTDNSLYYKRLDIYLLLKLIKLSSDQRAQVRDGSLQTFFEILDIHGSLYTEIQWESISNLIFSNVFTIQALEVKELKETINLKLDGMCSIFNKFHHIYTLKYWQVLIDYMTLLTRLDKLVINTVVLRKFNDILIIPETSKPVNDELFKFWINFPVEYDFVDPEMYIECLGLLMDGFPVLFTKISLNLAEDQVQQILNFLGRCLRYPIIMNKSDNLQPTTLQTKIIGNIEMISLTNDQINSIIVRELSNIMVYQFKVRERIENKLNNSNLKARFKLPTFISIGNLSFDLINGFLQKISQFEILINDETILKLIKSLLDVIENKSTGNGETPLWISCNDLLISIIERLIQFDTKLTPEIWQTFLRSIRLCFNNNSKEYEDQNCKQYFKITKLILPIMRDEAVIHEFLRDIHHNSYLYEKDEIEAELIDNFPIDKVINNLVNYRFEDSFGNTKPRKMYHYNRIKLICLEQLIHFANCQDPKFDFAADYFIARIAFTLRGFIEKEMAINKQPISRTHTREIEIILHGLQEYVKRGEVKKVKQLIQLLIKLNPINSNIQVSKNQILLSYQSCM